MAATTSRALASLRILTPLSKVPRLPSSSSSRFPFSSASPYPLYYELVHYRPARRPPPPLPAAAGDAGDASPSSEASADPAMDRAKRRYYRKRENRLLGGSDSDDDRKTGDSGFVELKPEIVDFPRLHAREEELYFHDAFAYPWEKEKHYRMVYQLEKKYFPDQSLDKAFVDPAAEARQPIPAKSSKKVKKAGKKEDTGEERNERGLVFFEEEEKAPKAVTGDLSEKKVEDFFKCLKKVPNAGRRKDSSVAEVGGEPYLVSRKTDLPPRWDGPCGTVVLVDKPKG